MSSREEYDGLGWDDRAFLNVGLARYMQVKYQYGSAAPGAASSSPVSTVDGADGGVSGLAAFGIQTRTGEVSAE